MKKLFGLAVALCLSLGCLTGCGETDTDKEKSSKDSSSINSYEEIDNPTESDDSTTDSKPEETTTTKTTEKPEETTTKTTEKSEETTTTEKETKEKETDEPAEQKSENTYEHNEYYDIVETATYKNSIDHTIVIHKVLAKKDVSISSTLLAYAADGSVIDKSSDDIKLTEGKYNYFQYFFESDISNATIKANFKEKDDSFTTGERNAVEMVQYDKSDDDLYITFKQTVDKLGSFAKFKILFYKGDKIVDAEDGYFSTHAENLNGNGATDVAEIWVFGTDYDRIEYIFEP